MEYYLIENFKSSITIPSGCKAVALTPMACYQLEKCGINYTTFYDYFLTNEIRGDADKYWDSQHQWFGEFDKFIRSKYPAAREMNVSLATLYSVNIKNLVDTVIMAVRILNRFIDLAQPTKIWFIADIQGEDKVERKKWFSYGESIFCRVIERICETRGVEYSRFVIKYDNNAQDNLGKSNKTALRNIIMEKTWAFFRALNKWYYENPYLFFYFPYGEKTRANILAFKGVDFVYEFCKDCRKKGFNIFIKNGDYVYKPGLVPRKLLLKGNKDERGDEGMMAEHDFILYELMHSRIMGWINEQCKLDVSDILCSRFEFLICDLFPKTLERIKELINFYKEHKIDYIVNYSLSMDDDFAAVAAAKVSENTKSVGLAHGADALTSPHRYIGEYYHYDFYFMSTADEVDNVKILAKIHGDIDAHVSEYTHFRTRLSEKAKVKKVMKLFSKKDKPIILFAPMMYSQRINMLMEKGHPLQWDYFKLYTALIEYFISRNDYYFIWKAHWPSSEPEIDPIKQRLKNRGASNITYSSSTLEGWLSCADKLLFDCPSTAFYKGLFVGKPTLSLFSRGDQEIRKGAVEILGDSLKPYSTIREALDIVDKFVDDDPNKYIVSMAQNNVYIPDILTN